MVVRLRIRDHWRSYNIIHDTGPFVNSCLSQRLISYSLQSKPTDRIESSNRNEKGKLIIWELGPENPVKSIARQCFEERATH